MIARRPDPIVLFIARADAALWQRSARLALQLGNLALARLAAEKGAWVSWSFSRLLSHCVSACPVCPAACALLLPTRAL